jgi:glycerol kinase
MELPVPVLRADGGATRNAWLMQFQADILGLPVEVAGDSEMTALGAAALAGLAVGVWSGPDEVAAAWHLGARYEPQMSRDEAAERLAGWHAAVERARSSLG